MTLEMGGRELAEARVAAQLFVAEKMQLRS